MTAIWTIVVGFVVGLVARAIMPGKDAAGFLVLTLLGVCGAVLGTLLGRLIGIQAGNTIAGFTVSVLGAVALLALYRKYGPLPKATQT
jgi:uncharacterized membrane protein YeaQ/YmgE (transglycosylase-associated protein family)